MSWGLRIKHGIDFVCSIIPAVLTIVRWTCGADAVSDAVYDMQLQMLLVYLGVDILYQLALKTLRSREVVVHHVASMLFICVGYEHPYYTQSILIVELTTAVLMLNRIFKHCKGVLTPVFTVLWVLFRIIFYPIVVWQILSDRSIPLRQRGVSAIPATILSTLNMCWTMEVINGRHTTSKDAPYHAGVHHVVVTAIATAIPGLPSWALTYAYLYTLILMWVKGYRHTSQAKNL